MAHSTFDMDDGTLLVSGICPILGKRWDMTVDKAGYLRWVNGELIQNAFPKMNPAHREQLMTGITPEGWDSTFGTEED